MQSVQALSTIQQVLSFMVTFRYRESFSLICSPRFSTYLVSFRYREKFCLICSP